MSATQSDGFAIERSEPRPNEALLVLSGRLAFHDAPAVWKRCHALLSDSDVRTRVDLSRVDALDGGTASLLLELVSHLRAAGKDAEIVGARGKVRDILSLYAGRPGVISEEPVEERMGVLNEIGQATTEVLSTVRDIFAFVGDMTAAALAALRHPGTVRWRAVGRLMERTGADALPIVSLMTFLVGLVTAFQAAVQLKQVGANIFVADLVALSVTRELGPLMTAVIAAGRSGAAFAAELGTMRVSEEIDALQTLELDPYRFLVFPRVLALVLVVPLLTLVADVVGILGGMVVGVFSLDLTVSAFMNEAQSVLTLHDVFSGVIKSAVFAAAIAMIACQRGLATAGGAEGVGRSTTSAVVTILFSIILIDAAFTAVFHVFGL